VKVFMTQALEPEGVAILERVAEVVSPSHLNPLKREELLGVGYDNIDVAEANRRGGMSLCAPGRFPPLPMQLLG
jgi:hypothetical protein